MNLYEIKANDFGVMTANSKTKQNCASVDFSITLSSLMIFVLNLKKWFKGYDFNIVFSKVSMYFFVIRMIQIIIRKKNYFNINFKIINTNAQC